jgi:hypothetical protein
MIPAHDLGEERAEPVQQAKAPRATIQDIAARSGHSISFLGAAPRPLRIPRRQR